ncbi:MAG: CoA-disulfide reductase [Tissierellia bacterium]|nr:CoA-disulfide reductase [Tissierellia bacterium]
MEILIIGGIAAGMSIAAKAKRVNPQANVTVIEKEDYISFGACGLPYFVGEQFENGNIMYARSPEKAMESGINLLLKHEALNIDFDKKEVLVKNLENDEELVKKYDRLAIATGATPMSPLKEAKKADNLYSLTKLRDAKAIKERLETADDIVVIGGGFIGVEVAEQIAHLGKKVKLIQRSDVVMRKVFDNEYAQMITEALKENNVDVQVNSALEDYVIEDNLVKEVITSSGSFKADLVIEALGFRPNTGFITDERLEKIANGAIVIDEYGKTCIEDVYAAGDCATVYHRQKSSAYIALATYANKMGRLVGENIVSDEDKQVAFIGALGSSLLRVGEYGAGVTGLTEEDAKNLNLNYGAQITKTSNHSGYWPGQSRIHIKLVYDKDTRVILGAQVFGKYGAAERLQALTMAVYNGNTVDELGFMDFAYAPPFANAWEALNVAGNAVK